MAEANPETQLYKLPDQCMLDDMVIPGKLFEPKDVEKLEEFVTYSDDVIIAAYPRSGMTWMSEIVSLLVRGVGEDHHKPQSERVRFLEHVLKYNLPGSQPGETSMYKTHLPAYKLMTQIKHHKSRLIVVVRNPFDVLNSLFYFYRSLINLGPFEGTFNEFFKLYEAKQLTYGDWMAHVKGYLQVKPLSNVLFIPYEECIADLHGRIITIANFLNLPYEDNIEKICKLVSFDSMKKRADEIQGPDVKALFINNDFIRNGKVGGWRQTFETKEQKKLVAKDMEAIKEAGLTLTKPYGWDSDELDDFNNS